MKIGILGTGDVGRTLGLGLVKLGHEVMLGSRRAPNPGGVEWAAQAGSKASVGTFRDAATFGEVLFLSVKGSAAQAAIEAAGAMTFSGKVVVDTMNPLVKAKDGVDLFVSGDDSLGERVQRWLPGARVVKAFNTAGSSTMVQPSFAGGPPDLFIAGNDEHARTEVSDLVRRLGWNPVDVGGIEGARLLEAAALLWIRLGRRSGNWNQAWKLLKA